MKMVSKVLSLLLAIALFFSFGSSLGQANAARNSGKTVTECTGYGYYRTCTKYVVYHHDIYFSKSDVEKIIKRYEKNSGNRQQIIDFIISFYPPAGIAVLFKNIGFNNMIGDFQAAEKKNKGLRLQYDVYVPQSGPNIVKIKNYKKSYK